MQKVDMRMSLYENANQHWTMNDKVRFHNIYDMIGFCPSEDLQLPCHQRSARLSQLPQCSPETGGEMAKWTAGQDGDSNVFHQPWGNRLCKTNKAPDSMSFKNLFAPNSKAWKRPHVVKPSSPGTAHHVSRTQLVRRVVQPPAWTPCVAARGTSEQLYLWIFIDLHVAICNASCFFFFLASSNQF